MSWRHAAGYSGSYRVRWAEGDKRLGAFHERGWYSGGTIREGDWHIKASDACDADGYCAAQLGDFDPDKHYMVEINTTERDRQWNGSPVHARHDP